MERGLSFFALALAIAGSSALPQHLPSATSFASAQPQPTLDPRTGDGQNILPNLMNSSAVDAQDVCPGYAAKNIVRSSSGVEGLLFLEGEACNVYGLDIDQLQLRVQYQSKDRLSVQIHPAQIPYGEESWYLPDDSQTARPSSLNPVSDDESDWVFTYTESPFEFKITRKATGDVVFDTTGSKLVFENQFVEFKSALPSGNNVYGLGEAITDRFRLGESNRTIFAADIGDVKDANLYGTHPFYLEQRYATADGKTKGYAHGVYNRNFHGQDVLVRDDSITYRIIGGSIELYFYSGPTPLEVTKSYVRDIGLPALQQYWTFGFHQCRWGYENISELAEVVKSYRDFDIPLETIWSDIDYMYAYRDFTTDPVSYPEEEFAEFLDTLHSQDQHYVPIVDAAIYIPNPANASDAYDIFEKGNASDAFIKNQDGSLYIGAVWPGFTVFPDWSAAGTQGWWTEAFTSWYRTIRFDGIWLDMNEVSSFCVGSCGTGQTELNQIHVPFALPGEPGNEKFVYPEDFAKTNASEAASASSALSSQNSYISATSTPTPTSPYLQLPVETSGDRNLLYPPYAINNFQEPGHDLGIHAIELNATHADGTVEYDVHGLWGFLESKATYNTLMSIFPGKRPFIVSRSTAPGSGKYAAHWGGDNASLFYYLRRSIQQALNFSLFGVPMFGVDTCGFDGNADLELCSRWMQLSAFFPFYRNHNIKSAIPQEAYRWADVASASRTAMTIRYSLLPYIYTLMNDAHNTGATVMRALSWEFPDDPSLVDVDAQFMLGSGIMVLPALDPGVSTVSGVFPGGTDTTWYDWYTGAEETKGKDGANVTIDAPLGHIPVYVQGGTIIPLQQPAYTTKESRQNPFELLIALGPDGTASGELYLDDGESISPKDTILLKANAEKDTLVVNASTTGNPEDIIQPLATVYVYGVAEEPSSVYMGSAEVDFEYDSMTKKLTITNLEKHTQHGSWVAGKWKLTWSSQNQRNIRHWNKLWKSM